MIVDRILQNSAGGVPQMVDLKLDFMTENPFRFFRGSCGLFYEELSKATGFPAGPAAWICGDLHIENFGAFRGSNRLVYFDLNDFDESILAPATWEVVRTVASIFVAFDTLKIGAKKARKMAELYLRTYSQVLAKGKAYYLEPRTSKGIVCDFLQKASNKKRKSLIKKRTVWQNHRLVVEVDDPRHDELDAYLKRELMHHLTEWIIYNDEGPYNYEVIDVAFRIAGTGSVGQKRYMFLLQSLIDNEDYLLVDMKQAVPSSLQPFVTLKQPEWESEAHRIVSVQERMQNVPPALLSRTDFNGESYILQELQPVKDSINFNMIKDRYRDVYQVIDDMAMLTASAQLRSSGRQGSAIADELIAFGENESWQAAVLQYAYDYCKRLKEDFKIYRKEHKATRNGQ